MVVVVVDVCAIVVFHYENMPMQYIEFSEAVKIENFQ